LIQPALDEMLVKGIEGAFSIGPNFRNERFFKNGQVKLGRIYFVSDSDSST
jgi:hypothetical protein